ncbi:MAG: DUF6493 family protein, partial [Planctomycetota bacterium]
SILSTPTHVGGWIDPRVWVSRFNEKNLETRTCAFDWAISLLRLSPDGREEAWREYQSQDSLPAALHDLVRLALTGEMPGDETDANPYALLAAMRSSDRHQIIPADTAWATKIRGPESRYSVEFLWTLPSDQDPAYPDFPIVALEPTVNLDTVREQAVDWFREHVDGADSEVDSLSELSSEASEFLLEVVRRSVADEYLEIADDALPPVSLYANLGRDSKDLDNQHWDFGFEVFYRSLTTLWPADLDWVWARATRDFVYRSANGDAKTCFPEAVLAPLRRPEVVLTRMAARLLWLGFGNKAKRVDEAAVDAFAAVIESERFDLDLMIDVFGELRHYSGFNFKRIAESLGHVAEHSSTHALAVSLMIDGCLQAIDPKARNYAALAELAVNGFEATQEPVSDAWKDQLATVTSGRLKQIANRLRQLG